MKTRNFGKASALAGCGAVVVIAIVGLSLTGNPADLGLLTGWLAVLLDSSNVQAERSYQASGIFPIHEANLRLLFMGLSGVFALLAGVLAVIAAKVEKNSLWYSVGLFAGASALSGVNYVLAGLYLLVFGWLVMRARKWRMTVT